MSDRNANDNDTLAGSPKDPATGAVKPHAGPLERPGTEAAEQAAHATHPPEPPGEGPGRAGERAAAYRENDA